MKFFYEKPMQVKFKEKECDWQAGIAYGDKIICCCCGALIKAKDIEEIIPLTWIDITESIIGE